MHWREWFAILTSPPSRHRQAGRLDANCRGSVSLITQLCRRRSRRSWLLPTPTLQTRPPLSNAPKARGSGRWDGIEGAAIPSLSNFGEERPGLSARMPRIVATRNIARTRMGVLRMSGLANLQKLKSKAAAASMPNCESKSGRLPSTVKWTSLGHRAKLVRPSVVDTSTRQRGLSLRLGKRHDVHFTYGSARTSFPSEPFTC